MAAATRRRPKKAPQLRSTCTLRRNRSCAFGTRRARTGSSALGDRIFSPPVCGQRDAFTRRVVFFSLPRLGDADRQPPTKLALSFSFFCYCAHLHMRAANLPRASFGGGRVRERTKSGFFVLFYRGLICVRGRPAAAGVLTGRVQACCCCAFLSAFSTGNHRALGFDRVKVMTLLPRSEAAESCLCEGPIVRRTGPSSR